MRLRFGDTWWRVPLSTGIVIAITDVCHFLFGVNATTAGFAYLVAILFIAASWGLRDALVASTGAAFCFNYFFLPPVGQLAIADPANWVALVAFLATSLVASHLSDHAKKQALEAKRHQADTERLYELSQSILFAGSVQDAALRIAQQLARVFECASVALHDPESGQCFFGGRTHVPGIEEKLRRAASQSHRKHTEESNPDMLIARISKGDTCLGVIAFSGLTISDAALKALLRLVALALEGVRAQAAATRAEAVRQSQQFKSTMLDAITHEFRTPLASVRIAASGILQEGLHLPPRVRDLASIIDEESSRLNSLISDAVRMSQVDASCIHLEKKLVIPGELVGRVLSEFTPRLDGRSMNVHLDQDLPRIAADPDLASMALRQVIDNSLKYSEPGTPLEVTVDAHAGNVVIRVRDHGPGIPVTEHERIFDRFYRRKSNAPETSGSGLGLYIAREIIRTHGGNVWVESAGDTGSEFCIMLPVHEGV